MSPPSLDELQKDNDLTSWRSRLALAASDFTSLVDEIRSVSCRRLISFMLLFSNQRSGTVDTVCTCLFWNRDSDCESGDSSRTPRCRFTSKTALKSARLRSGRCSSSRCGGVGGGDGGGGEGSGTRGGGGGGGKGVGRRVGW
jgi:uncharacterized membrane protein YgcG